MIISRPSRVRIDSGDQSSLPVRTDNNFLLLALWPWKSREKRREPTSSRSIVDAAHSLPPVALPAAPPSFSPATTIPVVTTHTRSFLPFDEIYPASSSQSIIPLETTPVSSNTLPPRSTPPAIYLAETGTVSEDTSTSSLQTPTSTVSISSDFQISPPTVVADDGLDLDPGLDSAVTGLGMTGVNPDLPPKGNSTGAGHNTMIGAALVSVLLLLLLGIIFYLRRRVIRNPSRPAVDMDCATPGVSTLPRTFGQQEGSSTIAQDRSSFIDRNAAPHRESALTVATAQGRCSQPGRYSQISIASSISRSIRFATPGSFSSSAGSRISRAAVSIIAVDGTHSPCDESLAEPVSPWRPLSVNTSSEYSASWRGANLSNIINAARGIKG